jgi:type I restriction enzyme M protein
MKICDPTCGSGGMLIWSTKYIQEHGGNPNNLTLDGQERNYGNFGMCKMNMILHGVENFRIEHENVLTNPLLIEDGSLIKYDRVIANFPFSMDWLVLLISCENYSRSFSNK